MWRYVLLSISITTLFIPAAFANESWCAPEYGSCSGGGEGSPPSGESTGGSSGTCNGIREWGSNFDYCSSRADVPGVNGYCWECQWVPARNAISCTGLTPRAGTVGYCYCAETYRNCLLVGCRTTGFCSYYQ